MKKLVLIGSVLGVVFNFLTRYSVQIGLCDEVDRTCRTFFDRLENIFYFFPIILLFSLITYTLPEPVFRSWFKFSLIWVPIVLVSTTFVRFTYTTNGGFFDTPDFIILPVTIGTYGIYVLGSIFTIVRNWRS
jgi:hypothetical protein